MSSSFTRRLGVLVAVLTMTLLARAAPDPQTILTDTDAIRNPPKPFSVTVNLLEYRSAKQTDANTLTVYSKADDKSGQYRSLIRFVAPERDANKQRLLGQASNGDVVTVNLAKDYKAELLAEEDTADGEKQTRRAYKLGLSATSPDVTYHRVEMWVDAASSRPIKARFYSESGHLLKTAYYRKYQPQLGRERPTEVVIIDGLDPSWVTVLRYSDYAWREVPDAWLQRDYLPRFKPG